MRARRVEFRPYLLAALRCPSHADGRALTQGSFFESLKSSHIACPPCPVTWAYVSNFVSISVEPHETAH
jgi:hypothetical protein